MKKFSLILTMLIVALFLTVSAMAETPITFSFDMEKDASLTNGYRIDVSVNDTVGDNFKSIGVWVAYDESVIKPYDNYYDCFLTEEEYAYCIVPVIEDNHTSGRPPVTKNDISYTPGLPIISTEQFWVELYDSDVTTACLLPDNQVLFSIYVGFVEGKSEKDITADTFKITDILFLNDVKETQLGRDAELSYVNNVVPAASEPETPDATVTIGGGVAGTEQEVNGIKFSTTFALADDVTADEVGYLVSSSNNVASADDVTYENTEDLVLKTSKTEFTATLEAFLYASDPDALAGQEDVEVYVRPYIVVNDAVIYGTTQTTTIGEVLEANN